MKKKPACLSFVFCFFSLFLEAADETAVKRSRKQEGEDVANRLWTPEEKRLPGVYSSQRAPVCLVQQEGCLRGRVLLARRGGGALRKSFFCGYSQHCSGGGGVQSRIPSNGREDKGVTLRSLRQKRIACFWAVFVILEYK